MGKLTNAEHAERFGKRLSDIMYNRNMTQAQLAQALHVPNGTVYNWKHGLRIPRAATLDEICRVLMCTRADLMDDPVDPVTDDTPEVPKADVSPPAITLPSSSTEKEGIYIYEN